MENKGSVDMAMDRVWNPSLESLEVVDDALGEASAEPPTLSPMLSPAPVIMVHGVGARPSFFWPMRRYLERRHGLPTATFTYRERYVEAIASDLLAFVQHVRQTHRAEKVHVVGHSLGGIIARWMLHELGGDAWVETLVTLATPHHGTRMAYLLSAPKVRALRPGSALLERLEAAAQSHTTTRIVSLSGTADLMVWPNDSAQLPGAENITLPRLTHNGYFLNRQVWQLVAEILSTPS